MFWGHRKNNFACVDCRTTAKAQHYAYCPACSEPMENFGTRYRFPKKTDNKGWLEVERRLKHWKASKKESADRTWWAENRPFAKK